MEKLKNAYKGVDPDSDMGRVMKRAISDNEKVAQAWAEAVVEAGENYQLQDGQKNNARVGERYSDRAAKKFSYDYFEQKAEAQITDINADVGLDRKEIRNFGIKSALQVGEKNQYGSVSVYVDDLGGNVIIGKDGVGHSLRREKGGNPSENYIVAANAGPIIKNSILVNELTPKKDNATGAYVLIGVARDQHGTGYIVESIVNKFSNELESMDVLYSMNAKKELAALNAPGATLKTLPVTSSDTSIPSVLRLVNDHFSDTLPEEVLKHYGHTERPAGKIGESALYSSRNVRDAEYMELAKDPDGNREALQQMVKQAAKDAGYTQLFYHGSKKGGGFTVFRDWQYFTENRDYAKRYTDRNNEKSLYTTYVKMENPFDTRIDSVRDIFEDARMEYGMGELLENGLPDWTDGYDIADYIDENDLPYDSIVLDEGGDMVNGKPVRRGLSYVVQKSNQVKSADAVTEGLR